jgi:hypothetical protein
MNSPMRNPIVHEVETTVSNTKQDLLKSMAVLIDSRLQYGNHHVMIYLLINHKIGIYKIDIFIN